MKKNDEKVKAVLKCYAQVLKDFRRLECSMRVLRDCLVECGFMEIPPRREFTQEDFDKAMLSMEL